MLIADNLKCLQQHLLSKQGSFEFFINKKTNDQQRQKFLFVINAVVGLMTKASRPH
jgi:hypothetical protein